MGTNAKLVDASPAVVLATADADDRALLCLFNASYGPAWVTGDGQRIVGWKVGIPLMEWSRVDEKDGRAVGLKLYLCNLMGFIPQELGQLTFLQTLDLGNNKLFGSIPPELSWLRALRTLDLYSNELSGPIPPELGELSELQELNLSKNHFVGTIPAALARLRSLEILRLTDNLLSGSIPPELGQLTELRVLKLNGNRLEGKIPVELGDLSSLVSLWLNNNMLSGNIPQELGSLGALESLWLKKNKEIKCEQWPAWDALFILHNRGSRLGINIVDATVTCVVLPRSTRRPKTL